MRILLDGMGGDNAPQEIVKGAVLAAELIEEEIVIIGREEAIKKELKRNKYKGTKITVVDAREEITMHDSPVKAIREKKDSSLVVGLNMLKEGKGDLFVSAGNTGALIVGSRLLLGRIRGIDRPALASIYPDMVNMQPCLLVDAGASAESKAQNLLEYGLITEAGRLQAPGRPILLATTEEFLRSFGVSSIEGLPDIDEVKKQLFEEEAETEIDGEVDVTT